jgi:hypothetical protein
MKLKKKKKGSCCSLGSLSGNDLVSANSGFGKNGYAEYLIDEEDDRNDQSVILKCAEIQNAIFERLRFCLSISKFSILVV